MPTAKSAPEPEVIPEPVGDLPNGMFSHLARIPHKCPHCEKGHRSRFGGHKSVTGNYCTDIFRCNSCRAPLGTVCRAIQILKPIDFENFKQ